MAPGSLSFRSGIATIAQLCGKSTGSRRHFTTSPVTPRGNVAKVSFEKMKKLRFSTSIGLGYLVYSGSQAYEGYKYYPTVLSQMDENIAQRKHHEEQVAKACDEIIRLVKNMG